MAADDRLVSQQPPAPAPTAQAPKAVPRLHPGQCVPAPPPVAASPGEPHETVDSRLLQTDACMLWAGQLLTAAPGLPSSSLPAPVHGVLGVCCHTDHAASCPKSPAGPGAVCSVPQRWYRQAGGRANFGCLLKHGLFSDESKSSLFCSVKTLET